ncbi:spore germination protein [Bacillus shivajii]|uniref:spore germination protein n=1 Tax=Bacillus shivajii TaxID=1983719 RepID=UPI001CF9C104|nr:spore germination protein [Bacillus shivajii]UCZ53854.1 spore germination protein [Bacillus shivajii]
MLNKLFHKLSKDDVRKTNEYDMELSTDLNTTVQSLKNIFGESDDIIQYDFKIGNTIDAVVFFIDGLTNRKELDEFVIKPLQHRLSEDDISGLHGAGFLDKLLQETIHFTEIEVKDNFDEAVLPFMSGESLLFIQGLEKLIVIGSRQYNMERSVEEPESEIVVRGPRDGFTESLQTNVLLIRRRVRDPNLTVQLGQLGRRSKSDFALLYLKGVVNDALVEEVRYRISCVDVDNIPESGTVEQLIEDNVLSPFPQILQTERPDKTASALQNGQVIIILDGTPFSLLTPITLEQLFKSSEDYYDRWQIGTLIRVLRYIAGFIALFLPALYISMVSFHQGMIPTTLALSIAGGREGVPFPSYIEAFLMEFTLEMLREAGIRLPRAVGSTIGIVGGLVIGDAAVRAGIVNPIMVIVVALTAISSFAIPAYNVSIALRMLRFFLMIAAATFGLFGVIVGYIMINIHLVGLRSFGSYYTSPFAPYRLFDLLDTVIRVPLTINHLRNDSTHSKDSEKKG